MLLERRKTRKCEVRAEENQEKLGWSGEKPKKAELERRKTKKSGVRAEENKEKRS